MLSIPEVKGVTNEFYLRLSIWGERQQGIIEGNTPTFGHWQALFTVLYCFKAFVHCLAGLTGQILTMT